MIRSNASEMIISTYHKHTNSETMYATFFVKPIQPAGICIELLFSAMPWQLPVHIFVKYVFIPQFIRNITPKLLYIVCEKIVLVFLYRSNIMPSSLPTNNCTFAQPQF